MTNEQKHNIVAAANEYMATKGLSQNALAQQSNINVGYLSYMLKGEFTIKNTEVNDKWFMQLADYVGFKITINYWPIRQTTQFMATAAALEDAKKHPRACIVIGDTGSGKTTMQNSFCNKYPLYTYRLIVADHFRMSDITGELCELIGVPKTGAPYDQLVRIRKKILEIKQSGHSPIIIVDEAENLKVASIKLFKAIYDRVGEYCSIVLFGTDDLIQKIERGVKKGTPGLPQFKRRFKAGIMYLPMIDRTFTMFLTPLNLEKGLVKLLQQLATNYGELHDYLEPALREADELGVPLTEDLFRLKYNMPK